MLMIDASRGLLAQDKAIADKVCAVNGPRAPPRAPPCTPVHPRAALCCPLQVVKQAKSCILVGNKCDLLGEKEWEAFKLKVEG